MSKTDKTYEAMFLLPAAATSDAEGGISTCRALVEKHGGKIILAKKFDERRLAYEVKKNKRGLYVLVYFTSPTAAIDRLNREVNLTDGILRVLVTDASHLTEEDMQKVEAPVAEPERPRRREDAPAY